MNNYHLKAQAINIDSLTNANTLKQEIRLQYSTILSIPADSVCCTIMYELINKWPIYIKNHPAKLQQSPDGVFTQYIYYLAFATKLPSNIEFLYIDKKAYRFKNLKFIRSGDLIFYNFLADKPQKVALYLQNNIVVYPDTDGKLIFIEMAKIKEKGNVISAKIMKDE